MRLKDIELGTVYAINWGSGIEKGQALKLERTSTTGVQGVMMQLVSRQPGTMVVWVAPAYIKARWIDYVQMRREQQEMERQHQNALVDLKQKLVDAMATQQIPCHVGIHQGRVRITLANLDAIRMLIWALSITQPRSEAT